MAIKDHGFWDVYTPKPYPKGAPAGMAFCRRDGDGVDWYEYIKKGFAPDTVKLVVEVDGPRTADGPIIRVPAIEPDRMFPQGCRVVELTGVKREQNEAALIEEFANRHIDLRTGTVGEVWRAPVPPVDSRIMKVLDRIMDRLDRLEAK
jgi:hypothetical protein